MPYDFGSGPFDRRMKVPCNPSVQREAVYVHRRSGWIGNPNEERAGGFFGQGVEDNAMEIWDGKRFRLEREANEILRRGEVCAEEPKEDSTLLLLLLLLVD